MRFFDSKLNIRTTADLVKSGVIGKKQARRSLGLSSHDNSRAVINKEQEQRETAFNRELGDKGRDNPRWWGFGRKTNR